MTSKSRSKSQYTTLKILKIFSQDGIDFLHGQGSIPASGYRQALALIQRHPDVVLVNDMANSHSPQQSRAAVRFEPHALVVPDHLDRPS